MNDVNLVQEHGWSVGSLFGYPGHWFFVLNIPTIVHTWIVMAFICCMVIILRFFSKKNNFIKCATLTGIRTFNDMVVQSLGFYSFSYFCFITTLFIFIALCNIAPVIPWLEEPTQDLNTTLALGLSGFFYTQYAAIREAGLWHYLKDEFLSPLWLLPLHVVGKLASILSISLRLFGNIFGGAMISKIYYNAAIQLMAGMSFSSWILVNLIITAIITATTLVMSTVITVFFTVLEGFLQAFVFTMLSLTYLSIAVHGSKESH